MANKAEKLKILSANYFVCLICVLTKRNLYIDLKSFGL